MALVRVWHWKFYTKASLEGKPLLLVNCLWISFEVFSRNFLYHHYHYHHYGEPEFIRYHYFKELFKSYLYYHTVITALLFPPVWQSTWICFFFFFAPVWWLQTEYISFLFWRFHLFKRQRAWTIGKCRSRLPAGPGAQCGPISQNPGIMTRAKGSWLTNWATRAPETNIFYTE